MRSPEESFASGEPETSRNVVKGALAGMAGGLVASWVMSRLQSVMESSQADDVTGNEFDNPVVPPIAEEQLSGTTYSSSAPALGMKAEVNGTKKVRPELRMANRISKTFLKHEIPAERENVAGQCTHLAFGTLVGGLYGAVAEIRPEVVSKLGGVPFGTAVWLLAEEIALPALHLTDAPKDVPLKKHATGLAGHFAYGATTDAVRRLLRKTVIH